MKKKLLSTILCLSLLFSLGVTNAWAVQDSSNPVKTASPESIDAGETYSMTGADLSTSLKKNIEEAGVPVCDDSDIQLLPVESSANGTGEALVVTNTDGPTMTKDVLLLVDDDGEAGLEKSGDVSTRAGSTAEFPPLSWDGRYVVRATAVYDVFNYSYYRPTAAYFTYKKYQECNLTAIRVHYTCGGFWYSYLGFQKVDPNEVEYVITVNQPNPVPSTMYMTNRTFPYSNRVINPTGSLSAGQYLTFDIQIDRVWNDYTVAL